MSRSTAVITALFLSVLASVGVPEAQQPGTSPATQTRGRAVTIEDYYRIQAIGGAAFSPNGKWVTFTVTTRREEPDTNSSVSDAWLVPSDASAAPRRVQHEGKNVTSPSWSEDGWLQVLRRRRAMEDRSGRAGRYPSGDDRRGGWSRRTWWTRRRCRGDTEP